ncbi:MAG: hypothetical protein ACOX3U_00900 [Christensenellales bacterium]|jgi:hypothetical protein
MKKEFVEDIVNSVQEEYLKAREKRKPLELQWRLNMNFLMGNQYSEISLRGDIEDYGKQYFWQEREVYNHIAPMIETRLSKLNTVKADVSVRPVTGDDSDINAAKLSSAILNSICEENDLSSLVTEANMWSEVCGSAFYKIVWNSRKGKVIGKSKNGEIMEGDIDIVVCPPYEIFPDSLNASDMKSLKSLIHARAYPVSEIKDMYGVDVDSEEVNVFTMQNSDIGGGLGYNASVPSIVFNTVDGYAVVLEKYEMPTKEFLRGRLITVCGDKLLYYGELPYNNGPSDNPGLPFVRQYCISTPGSFFGTSIIERVIPIQRAYNAVKNRKHEFLNRIAMGVLAVEDGSIDTDNLEEEGLSPGKILIYRQGSAPPQMLTMGRVPPEFTLEEERLLNEFIIISGVSEFMRLSRTPDNVTSGIALSLLKEQDDTRLSLTASSIRAAVKDIGRHILRLYKQFAKVRRLKRIAGDNGDIETVYFSGNDISSDDIVFDSESELMDTPANRKNMVLELLKMGVLTEETGILSKRTKLKILEVMGLGNWETVRDIDELHVKKATRENLEASASELMPDDIDDHQLHITEHIRYLISRTDLDDKVSHKLTEHIRAHKQIIALQAEQEDKHSGQ